ncbi:MAG TPA: endonuclease/exonuclease/phosphatase family protein [Candidatus Saccharimonadales bacterium]|nr:endonuclease/exonuclease/phosphatase family protein [Candidatus Saccharimonadales bacterium]
MTIKIASYNLWKGAENTYFRLIDFIKEEQFDVLCLQELNGWQSDDLAKVKDFADRAVFDSYTFCNSNSEYKLAAFSNLPVTFHNVYVEGFWHGVIEMHVKAGDFEFSIVNLHLDPYKEEPRMGEIHRMLELIDTDKPRIITGDFNSVSRKDNYPPEFLSELQKRKFYKFGMNELDFGVTDLLESKGYIDAAAQIGNKDTTVPSPYGENYAKDEVAATEAPARIDYFFVSEELVPMVKGYEVVKNHDTDRLSDHYPIVLTLEFADSEGKSSTQAEKSDATEIPKKSEPIESDDGTIEIKLH